MIDAIRAALAAIPSGVWAILLGLGLIGNAGWTITHTRQMQEERLRDWPGIWGSVFPAEWLEQKERGLRSRSDRVFHRIFATIGILLGVVIILLFGLPNL